MCQTVIETMCICAINSRSFLVPAKQENGPLHLLYKAPTLHTRSSGLSLLLAYFYLSYPSLSEVLLNLRGTWFEELVRFASTKTRWICNESLRAYQGQFSFSYHAISRRSASFTAVRFYVIQLQPRVGCCKYFHSRIFYVQNVQLSSRSSKANSSES